MIEMAAQVIQEKEELLARMRKTIARAKKEKNQLKARIHEVSGKVWQGSVDVDTTEQLHSPCCLVITPRKTLKRNQEDANEHADRALMLTPNLFKSQLDCIQVRVNQEKQQKLQQQTLLQQEQEFDHNSEEYDQVKKQTLEMAEELARLQQEQQAALFPQYQGKLNLQQQQEQRLQEEVQQQPQEEKEEKEKEDELVRAGRLGI
uniref:Uncharacterized protein n=1 Tax=Plectus sambesii TaxID=2011161 RepID=A0A914UWA7_9BILA